MKIFFCKTVALDQSLVAVIYILPGSTPLVGQEISYQKKRHFFQWQLYAAGLMLQIWMSFTENVELFVFFANTAMFQRLSVEEISFKYNKKMWIFFFLI